MDFKNFLSKIIDKVDGVKVISFCGVDGIGIDTMVMNSNLEKMETEVEISMILKMVNDLTRKMEIGNVHSFFFETDRMVGILERCAGDYFLSLLLNPDSNLGRARYELRKLSRKIEEELGYKGA